MSKASTSSTRPRMPTWILALAVTFGMQSIASFLDQSLAIIAPLLMTGAGLPPERVGNLSSLQFAGVVLFLLFGGPLLARLGPVRMLQTGAVVAMAGLLVAATGWWPVLVAAALMMGVGYGPSPPAGSRILAATAPPQHRTLIFSIKQAGAPAGGAFAGLILAPTASAWGWPTALILAVAIGMAAVLLIAPAREQLDTEKEPDRDISPGALFNLRKVVAPFLQLRANPVLLSVTALAFSFAIVQGSLFSFSVTYLVIGRHMPLTAAGLVYSCLQFAGVFARILLGWLADRTGRPAHNLTAQAFVAAALVLAYGGLADMPPVWVAATLSGATGFFAASWNGIYMAEVARLSPPEQIVEATASSVTVTFLGYVLGPSLFSGLVTWTGDYRIPFWFISGQLALMAAVQSLVLLRRRSATRQGAHAR